MVPRNRIVVGTRASSLAKRQTELVVSQLRQHHPDLVFQVKEITTRGDANREAPFAQLGIGAFVKELELALLNGDIDLAIHSFKDLPTEPAFDGLAVAAVPEREDARDVLVSRHGLRLAELPPGARVGTGSPRRKAQVLSYRPDLTVFPVRGNVDTRIRKVMAGELDAVVLAAAGLHRAGLADRLTEYLSLDISLPAVGQGALALQVRAADLFAVDVAGVLDHPDTRAAVEAERAFLASFGGGCRVPLAAYGQVRGEVLWLRGMVAASDGSRQVRSEVCGSRSGPSALGRELARRLLALGAAGVLQAEVP